MPCSASIRFVLHPSTPPPQADCCPCLAAPALPPGQGQGLARFFVALASGARESLKVLVTGRQAARGSGSWLQGLVAVDAEEVAATPFGLSASECLRGAALAVPSSGPRRNLCTSRSETLASPCGFGGRAHLLGTSITCANSVASLQEVLRSLFFQYVCRIRSEDLAFPEPPPRDDTAALEAAGATQTPMPEDGQQPEGRGGDSGTSGKWQPRGGAPTGTARVQEAGWQQRVARKAPGPPAAEALSKPLLGGEWAGGGVGTAVRVAQPALLAPHAPPTPSRGGAPSKGAASGAASGARAAAGALGF